MHEIWDKAHIAPFDLARAFPFGVKKLVQNSINRRMNLNDELLAIKVSEYIQQIILRKRSSEAGITVILAFRVYARTSMA